MSQIRKLKSFINVKTLSVFALTLFLGLFFNSIFGRHIFRYSITETFTESEAEAKLNKRVMDTCFDNPERTMGTVVSYHRKSNGEMFVDIKYDKLIQGKFEKISSGIGVYRKCIIEIADGE